MAYTPLKVIIRYTGSDKSLAPSKVIDITNTSHVKTLSTILATKPTAKAFDAIAAKARKILAVFIEKAKTSKGFLSDMQVHVTSNPKLSDGKNRPDDRFTEFTYSLSTLLAISNMQVRVIQRPTWTRGSGESDDTETDYMSELLA